MTYGKLRRLRAWQKKGYAPPYALELNPTFRCNLSCTFCSGAQYGVTRERREELTEELTDDECLHVVRQARALGVRELFLAGDGEPLFRNRLAAALIREAKKAGMRGSLTTNGTLLTTEVIEAAVIAGWDQISISIDAPDADAYDTITGTKGAFSLLKTHVEALRAARRRKGRLRPRLHINTVLFRDTYDKLPEMILLARDLGIPSISFEPFIRSPKVAHLDLGPAELSKLPGYVRKAESLARSARVRTNVRSLLEPGLVVGRDMEGLLSGETESPGPSSTSGQNGRLDALPCFQPWHKIVVRPDGAAYPCCNFYDASDENVRNRTLNEIWTGSYFSRLREEIAAGEMPRECEKCNEWLLRENRSLRRILESRFLLPAYLRHLAAGLGRLIP